MAMAWGPRSRNHTPIPRFLGHLVGSRLLVPPSALAPEDSLELAEAAMRLGGVSHLPVARGGELIGMVSLRAVLSGEIAAREDGDAYGERVGRVMSPPGREGKAAFEYPLTT